MPFALVSTISPHFEAVRCASDDVKQVACSLFFLFIYNSTVNTNRGGWESDSTRENCESSVLVFRVPPDSARVHILTLVLAGGAESEFGAEFEY